MTTAEKVSKVDALRAKGMGVVEATKQAGTTTNTYYAVKNGKKRAPAKSARSLVTTAVNLVTTAAPTRPLSDAVILQLREENQRLRNAIVDLYLKSVH